MYVRIRGISSSIFSYRVVHFVLSMPTKQRLLRCLRFLDARSKRCLEFASPIERSNGNARRFLPTSKFFQLLLNKYTTLPTRNAEANNDRPDQEKKNTFALTRTRRRGYC